MADQGKQIELATAYYAKGRKLWTKGGESKDEALVMFRKALAVQESVLGTYHKHTARTYYWIGFALKSKRDYDKAIVAYRRTLKIRISLFGEDDLSTEDAHRAVADVLKEKGFDEKAIEDYSKAVADSVRFEEKANGFFEKGAHEQAVTEYQKCLEIEEAALGKYPLDVAAIYSRIADVFKFQGEHDMAIVTYRDSLTIYEAKLGTEHPDTIKTLKGIELAVHLKGLEDEVAQKYRDSVLQSIKLVKDGNDLATKREFDQALGKYEEALNIEESLLGKYPLSTAEIYKKCAFALREKGKHDRAILALRTALSIFVYEFGGDHANVIATLKEIGHTIMQKGLEHSVINKYLNTLVYSVKYERYGDHIFKEGDYTGAIEEFQKSLALEVSALGKFHLTQAALYRKIAGALRCQERLDLAIVNHRHALGIFQSQLGKDHPDTAGVLNEAADTVRAMGLSDKEVAKYRESVSRSVQLERKGNSLFSGGDQENAIIQYLKAISFEEEFLGRFHLCTADLYYKIASTLKEKRKYDRALVKYRDVFAMYQLSLGRDHPNTQRAYEELGLLARLKGLGEEEALKYSTLASNSIQYEKTGDDLVAKECYDQGVVEYRRALEIEESGLGKFHLTTASIYSKIADAYRLQGQYNRSILEYRRALNIFESKLGSGHPDAAKSLENVCLAVEGLGLKAEHGRRYQKAVTRSIQHERRGDQFQKDRNHGKAVNEYRQAIALEEEILGKLHPATTELLMKIATICKDQEDYDSALLVCSKVLAINEAAFGKDNAETIKSFNDVSTVAQKQAAASGSTLEGWTTLNYILLGLIGVLILILNMAKALSKNERPLRNMKMPLYEVEIDDSGEIGETVPLSADKMSNDHQEENKTGIDAKDPEEIKTPSQAPQVTIIVSKENPTSSSKMEPPQDRSAFFSKGGRSSLDPPSEKLSEGRVGISLLSENISDLEAKSAENGEDLRSVSVVNGEDLRSVSVVNETIDFELPDVEEQAGNEHVVIGDDQVDEDGSMDGSATQDTFPSKDSLLARLRESVRPPLPSTRSNAPEDSRDTAEAIDDAAAAAPPNPEATQVPADEIANVEGSVGSVEAPETDPNKLVEPKDEKTSSFQGLSTKKPSHVQTETAGISTDHVTASEEKEAEEATPVKGQNGAAADQLVENEAPESMGQNGAAADQLVENEAPESMPKDDPTGKTDREDEKQSSAPAPDAGANPSGEQAIGDSPVEGKATPADDPNLTKASDPTGQAYGTERLEAAPTEDVTPSDVQADDSEQSVATPEQGANASSQRDPCEEVDGKKISEAAPTADTSEEGGLIQQKQVEESLEAPLSIVTLNQNDATSESETKEASGATLKTDSHDDIDEGQAHISDFTEGLEAKQQTPVDPTPRKSWTKPPSTQASSPSNNVADPPTMLSPPRKRWAPTPSAKVPEDASAQAAKTVVSSSDPDEEGPVISVADRLKAIQNKTDDRLKTFENNPAGRKPASPWGSWKK
jgi:tetratricopeptide (TPR) repeat protein